MDVERIVVRLVADASQYLRVLDAVQARLLAFGGFVGGYFARQAIELAADYERAAVAFEVMTKSAETGRKLLDQITKLAIKSPFTTTELAAAAKQALAFGFAVDDIEPILERLGAISAATGSDLSRLILAFGQVRTTGRLMGQELRQFTNAGVPILEYLSKVLGVTTAQVPNLVRQGRVGFADVAKAINMMTDEGGLFAGMLDRINEQTVYGRWRNLVETTQLVGRNLGGAFFEAFRVREALGDLVDTLSGLDATKAKEWFVGLRLAIFSVWKGLSELVVVVREFLSRNPEVVRAVLTLTATYIGLRIAVAAALFVLSAGNLIFLLTNPWFLATAAVGGLIIVLTELGALDFRDIFGTGFAGFGEEMLKSWEAVKEAVKGGDMEAAFEVAFATVENGWDRLMLSLEAAWHRFSNNIGPILRRALALMFVDVLEQSGRLGVRVGSIFHAALHGKKEGERFQAQELAKLHQEALAARQGVMDDIGRQMAQRAPEIQAEVDRIMSGVGGQSSARRVTEARLMANLAGAFGKGTTPANAFPHLREMFEGRGIHPGVEDALLTPPGGEGLSGVTGFAAVQGGYEQLYTNMVHRMHEVFLAAKHGEKPTEEMVKNLNASVKALDDFSASIMGVSRVAKDGISVTFEFANKDVPIFARDLQKEFVKGVGIMNQYRREVELVNQAFAGPVPDSFKTALAGVIGGGAFTNIGNLFGGEEKAFGLYRAFQRLQGQVGDRGERLPPALLAGTQEAQNVINRNATRTLSVQEQVLETIRQGNHIQEKTEKHQQKVVDVLLRMEAAGVPLPMGFGPKR